MPETFPDREDGDLVDGRRRSLGRRVVPADRLDRVSGELDADGLIVAGREDVDDSSAYGELAVLVGGIFAAEPRLDEMLAEELRIDFGPEPQREDGRRQPARRDQARQQRRRGRDDDTDVAGRDRRQDARTCGRHVQVRRQSAIRVYLVRRQRQHRGCGCAVVETFECRQEESSVGRGLVCVRVGGDDEHDESIPRLMRAKRRVKGAACRRQPGDRAAIMGESCAAGGRSKQGLKREGRGGRHDRRDLLYRRFFGPAGFARAPDLPDL